VDSVEQTFGDTMDALARILARWRSSPKTVMAALLPAVDRRLTVATATLVALSGLLPVCIIVLTSVVVGLIPSALGHGLGSGPGHRAIVYLMLLGVLFVALQAASLLRSAAAETLGRALGRSIEQRVMAAVACPAGTAHLEDAEMVAAIGAARDVVHGGYRPADAVPALAARATTWLQGAATAAVLATYQWWLAVLVYGAWIWKSRVLKREHLSGTATVTVKSASVRRAEYLRDLALTPPAAKEVRVFGLTGWLVDRFHDETAAVFGAAQRQRGRRSRSRLVVTAASMGASFLALTILGVSASHGHLGLRHLVLYVGAVTGINMVVTVGLDNLRLAHGSVPVAAAIALERRLRPDSGTTGETPSQAPWVSGDARGTEVRFEDVSFRYPGAAGDALSHLDLSLPAGRSVAIVGANGAGKSTLIKLLCQFHQPSSGRITVDGTDLSAFAAPAWQRRVAAVFQDFMRYPVSMADNIGFGAVEHRQDRAGIEQAAVRAGLREAIASLPAGVDTLLAADHTDGCDLSGGQWQRVAIARALFAAAHGARILVLDEPAANLDARGEAELYDRFLDLTAGVTAVIISHRFSTVRRADVIYVVADGRVVETGDHGQLMAAGGRYAEMFTLQAARLG
jgi:ATP-binding cassette subfamily B protein